MQKIAALMQAFKSQTGSMSDVKMFVTPGAEVVQVHTGERGEEAF
jgi:nitrogen regulatory protein PII